jgi:hypothetical protein
MALAAELASVNEEAFRNAFLMPLLQRLGFSIVINYHGSREFGRDVVFGDLDRFGHITFFGMQAKHEPSISLAASHDLVRDAREAFNHPFRHPQTGAEHHISGFYVATAGTISEQASENFFLTLANERLRNVRLLDGASLVRLNKWAVTDRRSLIRERLTGLLMEIKVNRFPFDSLVAEMDANVNQGAALPPQRARFFATGAFLAAPVLSEQLDVNLVEFYYQTGRLVNSWADDLSVPLRTGQFAHGRLDGLRQACPTARQLGDRIEASITAILAELGPLIP